LLWLLAEESSGQSGSQRAEAFSLRRRSLRGTPTGDEETDGVAKEPDSEQAVMIAPFFELQVHSEPLRIAKVFVPMEPEVARWWTDLEAFNITVVLDDPLTRNRRLRIQISGTPSAEREDLQVQSVVAIIELPESAVLEACQFRTTLVAVDAGPLADLGPIRALFIICPVQPGFSQAHSRGGNALMAVRNALAGGSPLRWLLLPWILLLMPFMVGSSMGPMALLAGACLTLASIACLSLLIAILIVTVQRRCASCARRWRRLWRLSAMARRPARMNGGAFGEGGPCCICLAEPDHREKLIVLLPCRHTLHAECYRSWVRADAYPSRDLICPLCRRRAEAIGKLGSQSQGSLSVSAGQ